MDDYLWDYFFKHPQGDQEEFFGLPLLLKLFNR